MSFLDWFYTNTPASDEPAPTSDHVFEDVPILEPDLFEDGVYHLVSFPTDESVMKDYLDLYPPIEE